MYNFNEIFSKGFQTSKAAVSYCQSLSKLCGFGVRIRTSKPDAIYLVCAREGMTNNRKDSVSKNTWRCKCRWRIILRRVYLGCWKFQQGSCSIHNHESLTFDGYLMKNKYIEPNTGRFSVMNPSSFSVHLENTNINNSQFESDESSDFNPPSSQYRTKKVDGFDDCTTEISNQKLKFSFVCSSFDDDIKATNLKYILN